MSVPINPNSSVPNFTPLGPGQDGFTPLEKLLIDTFSPSIGSILPTPPVDASNPQITMAEFFSSVSSAQLKQMLQDYVNRTTDPKLRQKLLEEIANRSFRIADVINLIVQYREHLSRLNQIDIQGKHNDLNNAIADFNSHAAEDTVQVNQMNAAITTYNTAQTNYQNALTTYDSAVATYTGAQANYNASLSTWNTALNNYKNGTITAAQLQAAEVTFNADKATFNTASSVLTGVSTTFAVFQAAWVNAKDNLSAKTTSYNDYVAGRNGDFQNAVQQYNAALQQALPIINEMAAIQAFLFGTSATSTPTDYTGAGLTPFSAGNPGPDDLRNQVQGTINTSNGTASSINGLIGQVSLTTLLINLGGFTPPLTIPPVLASIPNLPPGNSNYVLSPVSYNALPPDTFDFTVFTEFDTSFLEIMLNAVNEYNKTSDREDIFQRIVTEEPATFIVNTTPNSSVGVGSSVSVTANQASVEGKRENPHLLSSLSKHVFETVLNTYGVPAGSPLIDQTGALVYGYQAALGLISVGEGRAILGDNPASGAQGKAAASAAVALGNVSGIQALISGDQITADITRIVNTDASLAALTPEAKAALIKTLVQEVGATLIKSALNQLAASIDLPGLVSQLLANLTLLTQGPEPNLQQLTSAVILSQQLAKDLNLTKSTAERIVQNAIRALNLKNEAITRDAITQAIVDQLRADQDRQTALSGESAKSGALSADAEQEQISEEAALDASVHQSVVAAEAASSSRIQAEVEKSNRAKQDLFLSTLANGLETHQVDPAKIRRLLDIYKPTLLNALIGGLIKPNFLEALTNHLIKLPMTHEEASSVIQTALTKANTKDALLNPLSTFIGHQVLGLTDLSGLFKSQVTNILSPVIGERKALAVAEDYGRLIFADPNSTIKFLERHEKSLSALDGYQFNSRVFEDYRNAAQVFINPTAAQGNPLHEGNVLLLSGQAAGLSFQGTSSVDNALGPLAFTKKPIDMPG